MKYGEATNLFGEPHRFFVLAGFAGEAPYPKWLRPYLILLVSATWTGVIVAWVMSDGTLPIPPWIHAMMGLVIASLFRVEFGGIRLVQKERPNDE